MDKTCASPVILLIPAMVLVLTAVAARAGPVEFGKSELDQALRARGLRLDSIAAELRPGPPESWSIEAGRVTGGDERGLMYGLLEAAEQIRASGRLTPRSGAPATAMRGIRYFIHNRDMEEQWYFAPEYWDAYFTMLARNRFNRFNLVFAHQTNYLAPPYPYWIALPEFPQIRVPGLNEERRNRNLEMLRYISQAATDHGVDFTLGVWEHNVRSNDTPTVEGLTRENIGPYSRAALGRILQLCPAIRSVQMRTNDESGIPADQQIEFYRDYIFPAIKAAGRTLDFRGWAVARGMIEAAKQVGVTTRVSAKYWCEDIGRPYQPPETFAGYGYLSLLEKPRFYEFYWEIWGLGSHRILLWGNPDFVRRMVPTLRLSESIGFEIDALPTQRGFGNRPGAWDVFTDSQRSRVFWKWDFERYWLFYLLWGRLSYDPQAGEAIWMDEMRRRFGPAAGDVFEAYRQSSRVLHEIVAVHLADPNMYIWPEINPGGLIDSYKEVRPSDWRYIASIPETVSNLLAGTASAKQTALETADLFEEIAGRIDEAVRRASSKTRGTHLEWEGSRPDFEVLAHLARYHAHKQRAALNLEWFDTTGNRTALRTARGSLNAGLAEWERLTKLTDGLYSSEMANGPDDVGHWTHKLPYVRHDLELIREREEILERFGRFDFAFDFGAPVSTSPGPPSYRSTPYVRMNSVAPRFRAVSPETLYDEKIGYGWAREYRSKQEVGGLALTPYREVRAVAREPYSLPRDALFGDYIRGEGDQEFLVKALPGRYDVSFLHPSRGARTESIEAVDGFLRVRFPRGDWIVSGLVIKGSQSQVEPLPLDVPRRLPRPAMAHEPPAYAQAGQPLTLSLKVQGVATVRLHYRQVNQGDRFKTLEGSGAFTIPGGDISARWDLMYYFEVLAENKSGWFYPDPASATPYFVVATRP